MSAFNIKNIFLPWNSKDAESVLNDENTPDADTENNLPDEELVAVITAAVMAAMGDESKCGLIIKSIKRTGQTTPLWNRAGRFEHISGKL
jgi:hypothetical protein